MDLAAYRNYENTRSEWTAIEMVLKQREEAARCSKETTPQRNGLVNPKCNEETTSRYNGNITPQSNGGVASRHNGETTHDNALDIPLPDNFKKRILDRQISSISNEVTII